MLLPIALDVGAQAALVEGYTTNAFQSQAAPGAPVATHPALFTGVQGALLWRPPSGENDTHEFRAVARVEHYEPIHGEGASDDGTVSAGWSSGIALSPNTRLTLTALGTLGTVNAAFGADATAAEFDPLSSRRTYWLTTEGVAVSYEFAKTWRYTQAAGVSVGGTIAATSLAGGNAERGLDVVAPYLTSTIADQVSARSTVDVTASGEIGYAAHLVAADAPATAAPPVSTTVGAVTATAGWAYAWSRGLASTLRAGVSVATPPDATSTAPLVGPAGSATVGYTRDLWAIYANASYQYSALSPRVGAGVTATGGVTYVGRPVPYAPWRDLYLLVGVIADRTSVETGPNVDARVQFVDATAEARYPLGDWLGVLAGYDYRTSGIAGAGDLPTFTRHLVFVGLSGYWAKGEHATPLVTMATAPRPAQ